MIKKIISFSMVYALLFTSAFAGTNNLRHQSLKKIFDKVNFNLSVMWDQTDKEFYNSTVKEFRNALMEEKKKGLSTKQLLSFVESQIVDKAARNEFKQVIEQFDDSITMEEAQEIIADYRANLKETGANWLGGGKKKKAMFILCVIIFIAIGVGIYFAVRDDDDDDDRCYEDCGWNGDDEWDDGYGKGHNDGWDAGYPVGHNDGWDAKCQEMQMCGYLD